MTHFLIEKSQRGEVSYFMHGLHGGLPLVTSTLASAHRYPTESGAKAALWEFDMEDKGWSIRAVERKKN